MPVVPERTCRTYVAIQRQYDGRPQVNRNRKSKRKTLYRKIQGEATNPTRHRCAGKGEIRRLPAQRQERRQFYIAKETIDMINIKCHDMKHLIKVEEL